MMIFPLLKYIKINFVDEPFSLEELHDIIV